MGFFKDAGDSIAKYSNIFISKTEEYSRVAKITIEIKKLESEKGKIEKETGRYVIESISSGATRISCEDEKIKSLQTRYSDITKEIEIKQNEIEAIKKREEENDSKVKEEQKTEEIKPEEPAADESDKQPAE